MFPMPRTWVLLLGALGAVLLNVPVARADEPDDTVHVKYNQGSTHITTVAEGVPYFLNRDFGLTKLPPAIIGLNITQRAVNYPVDVTINAPKGVTVYLMFRSGHKEEAGAAEKLGWKQMGQANVGKDTLTIYQRTFSEAAEQTIPGRGYYGTMVAAKHLAVDKDNTPAQITAKTSASHADASDQEDSASGAATRVSTPQATIKSLEILETDNGLMLGQTSEMTLTVTRDRSSREVNVEFVGNVGDQMNLAKDDALRFIHVSYPKWYADKAEITFEDKYNGHDGGSNGAAVATMVMAVIKGFEIDSNLAMTGDISANGKVRAIGGVAAKIRGATASKCTLAAVPADNFDQLVDTVVYSGPGTVTDIQVIGITSLGDAVAVARSDRDSKLQQAITLFGEIQKSIKQTPTYLQKSKEAEGKLQQVLDLAPQHLSAKLLLMIAQNKLPKTLSATASRYYTFVAAGSMVGVLTERDESMQQQKVPSAAIREGLADLRKLRPLADPNVRPLVDAWSKFIEAWNSQQGGSGSLRSLENQRQALLDEMAKEQADANLMQKMLKEGM